MILKPLLIQLLNLELKMFKIIKSMIETKMQLCFQAVIELMQDPVKGVPIRTVNSFINKIPSVFTGNL